VLCKLKLKKKNPISSPCALLLLYNRDETWTGLRLDWIRTVANFVEFGLDPATVNLFKI